MNKLIFIIENSSEGGYMARALGTKMSAKADDLLSLREQVYETVRACLGGQAPDHIGFFDLSCNSS